jgi:FdhD protein
MNTVENVTALRHNEEDIFAVETSVAREFPFTIILNGKELVTLLCSPGNLKYLAAGFLASEGLIYSRDEIKKMLLDDKRGVIRVEAENSVWHDGETIFKRIISSGCGRGASFYSTTDILEKKVDSRIEISAADIYALVRDFQHRSELYQSTHGVHSAALCDTKNIQVFDEDIGRHNAIDKVFGKCLLDNISTENKILLTSGRITSEVLHKVAKRRIPIIASISAPTDLGINIAKTLAITLITSVRGKKMNVHTGDWRVISNGKLV